MRQSRLIGQAILIALIMMLMPNLLLAQIDIERQLRERSQKVEEYDDSDKDRHGDNMKTFYLLKRLGDKKAAFADTIKLNYFHRAFIEGLSVAEAYGGTYASPYQSKIYFDRPLNKWDEFYFTNPYNHLIRRGKRQQWYNVKVPYTFLKYTTTGSDQQQEQNFGFTFSSNLGPKWSLGGNFDLDYANGYYAYSKAKNVSYRVFASYEGDRYKAYASIGNTNVINQENGGITDPRFITNPNDFEAGRRQLLPKDIPTKYKSTWNRIVFGEGRFHHKYSLGFYKNLEENNGTSEQSKEMPEEGVPQEETATPELPTVPTPDISNDEEQEKVQNPDEVSEEKTENTPDQSNKPDNPPVRKRAGKSSGQQEIIDEESESDSEAQKQTKIFIPVTNFFHDFSLQKGRRSWVSQDPKFMELYPDPIIPRPSGGKFFPNDRFNALKISNTLGIEMLEGFHKWAKMGVAAFVSHDYEHYRQPLIDLEDAERLEIEREIIEDKQSTIYVGGRISTQSFKYFQYHVWGQIGVAGAQAGEIELSGELATGIKLFKKDIRAKATVDLLNTPPSYFLRHYKASLHEWEQDLVMIQVMRVGGEILIPFTQTRLHANFETLQNPIMVNAKAEPEQVNTNVRVLAIGIDQKISWRFLNWENSIIWQNSSNQDITPLPELSVYSNFYIQALIAKVMTLQIGADAKWHTAYYAPYYEPSTQLFKPQNEIKIGGEAPLASVYANVHLKRARFFLKYYNIGALIFKPNYFTMPYYPLYPPVLRLGLAIDLRN